MSLVDIGFQGTDPRTDFRGTGRLGMLNLHYFATKCSFRAIQCLNVAQNKDTQYFLACTSINITFMMLTYMRVSKR